LSDSSLDFNTIVHPFVAGIFLEIIGWEHSYFLYFWVVSYIFRFFIGIKGY